MGTGAGVPRGVVLMEICGGGVPVRAAAAGAGAALVLVRVVEGRVDTSQDDLQMTSEPARVPVRRSMEP